MSDVVQIPRMVWENILHKLTFIEKTIKPLAAGYKPPKWMNRDEVKELLQIGDDRLKQIRASGMILYRKCGKMIEYDRKDIEAYRDGRIQIPAPFKKIRLE